MDIYGNLDSKLDRLFWYDIYGISTENSRISTVW